MSAKKTRLAALLLLTLSPLAQAQSPEKWDWMVAPYGWIAGISSDVAVPAPPPGGNASDLQFNDIVDLLDGAFQIHAEGQGDQFGVLADFTYLGLADEKEFDRFSSQSDLDTRLFELAAVWSPGEDRFKGLDVFAGLRYIDIDATLRLDPVNPAFANTSLDGGNSYSDFMLGARYTFDVTERLGVTLRGDGSAGETEGSWNASVMGNYKMKHGAFLFGYRYFNVELGNDTNNIDLMVAGPVLGYAWRF